MIHLIHGIHTAGADQAPAALLPYLPPARYPDYGYELALATRILNPMIEGCLAPYIGAGDILIGHSNGCAIIYDLLQSAQVKPSGVVFINGALEQIFALPDCVQWCDVYYNPGDTITEAAKVAAELGLVDLCWGELGHAGYAGSDKRVTNINAGNTEGFPKVSGHSAIFDSANLPAWGPYIASRIR